MSINVNDTESNLIQLDGQMKPRFHIKGYQISPQLLKLSTFKV